MSIQKRLVGSYLVVIIATVLILEVFLTVFVRAYFYHNIERTLMNQAGISASFFQQYFAGEDLEKISGRLLSGFAHNITAQVQIIDAEGKLLQDSNGLRAGEIMSKYPDVQEARGGTAGTWRGREPSTNEPVLAVAYPLQAGNMTVGVVRFVTSLTETMEIIRHILMIFMAIGLMVLGIVALLSVFLSRTITGSIKELKSAAERMAEGDFSARANKRYQDELGKLADTLNTMAAKIQRNEQLKNEFTSAISHELRTPLTSIKGWVVTLKADPGEGEFLLQDGLDIIETETDRLTRLVDELLDFSKLDNGQIRLECAPLDLSVLLQHVGKQLAPRAARQGVSLDVQIDNRFPIIHADGNRLKQVLINLLDNSLKFTGSGGSIKVIARQTEGEVVISIQDTGSGIGEQDLAQVFQKFYKGDRHAAGSGLGLSISRQIIDLHQGKLLIHSQLGEGTQVEIYLPK